MVSNLLILMQYIESYSLVFFQMEDWREKNNNNKIKINKLKN